MAALFPTHGFFIFNGDIKPVSEFVHSENTGGVYEVLRVVNGVPIFTKDHILRLFHSAQIAEKQIGFTESEIQNLLMVLIAKNEVRNGNLLISFKTNLKIFFIPHDYPSEEMYEQGVECGVLEAERKNPNAKVFQTQVREKANNLIAENGYFEVALVDYLGRITEGSRSNLFFVKGDRIITSPGKDVLLGITRKKIIQLAKDLNISFFEKEILYKEISTFDALFITGTSPKILPVRKVANLEFNVQNEVVQLLVKSFDSLINEYIKTA
jgi:branched-chain amino acid aminotransferase